MFRKLRIQFVAVVMASVAVVLGIVFTGICVNEFRQSMAEVDEALSSTLDRACDGAQAGFDFSQPFRSGAAPFEHEDDLGQSDGFALGGPQIGMRGEKESRSIVPVAVYQVANDETYTIIGALTTAQIDSSVLAQAAEILSDATDGTGTLSELGLHYEKRTSGSTTFVAFADTSSTSSWESLATSLAIAGLGILVVFFVIALALSNWALKPVREAWDAQRQFVADASHELKTPLTVILANNSILLKHAQDSIASQSQWIESSQVEAENMQGLVNEMLELAQVESRAAVHHEPLDFSDLVDGIALQFESVAFERGCELNEQVGEGIMVDGDASRLRKAVSTLTENALKYVNDGGHVNVSLHRIGKNAVLEINNTGSLIAPEDLPHIFDRFYRTDKARTSGTGGYGLGLAIAREILREHEGDITCKSSESEGTTFIATLPCK